MSKIITSPINWSPFFDSENTLFLAGGITGCADWQSLIATKLQDINGLVIINPRRKVWDDFLSSENISREQIAWEHLHLKVSKSVMFWFASETLCPITLFEYGKLLVSNKQLFVGTSPLYKRRFDVIEQTRLEKPDLKIYDNLGEMADVMRSALSQ